MKKVPGIVHSKSPLKEIVKNLLDTKLVPLSSILKWSSSAICYLVCSQCWMLSVYRKCHLSLREIAAELSVSHESIRTILNDCLGMKRVAARLVLKTLNFLQKLNRVKAKNYTNIIEQPPYSPNMAPADFFFISKLKLRL